MSMQIHQTYTPQCPQFGPTPVWTDCPSLARTDPLLDRAMALAKIGRWSFNLSDDRLSWTSGVFDLFGLPIDTALDRRQTVEMYTEPSRHEMERVRAHAIAHGGTFTFDAQLVRADGELRWMRVSGEVVRHVNGAHLLHGLKQDVTDEKLRLEALRRVAENDALTGLASRAVFESRFLSNQLTARPVGSLGALILFDLDGFKDINDLFGHAAGDACLKVFAERLTASFPKARLIARIGGDEFAMIVGEDVPADLLQKQTVRFQEQLSAPFFWRENMLALAATSGMAVPSDPNSYDPEELFVRADAALYSAKRTRLRARRRRHPL